MPLTRRFCSTTKMRIIGTTDMVIVAISIPFMLLTVWAVVDAAQREFASMGRKGIWILVAAIPFVGFIPYFLIGRRQSHPPA